ncbi:unnamed protein product [Calypogeia fissa]
MDERALNSVAAGFCGQLKNFVTSLHSNTSQLRASISHKPPAYADLSSFLLDFNDRLAEDGAQMDLLEEMTVENVSFEELLAHCMELYKQNESSISSLESQLEQFGYSRGGNTVGGEGQALDTSFVEGLKQRVKAQDFSPRGLTEVREDVMRTPNAESLSSSNSSGRSYAHFETIRSSEPRARPQSYLGSFQSPLPSALAQSKLDSDDLSMLCESFSLEDFGISASSLASLARSDLSTSAKEDTPISQKQRVIPAESLSEHCSDDMDESCDSSPPSSPTHKGSEQAGVKPQSGLQLLGQITSEEYNQVLPWLRKLVSLEELNDIVLKINDAFHMKSETVGSANFDGKQLELVESVLLSLGSKMKSALFILVQMDKLVVAVHNSCTYYRPSELAKFR